jgi:hypothetical protein
MLIVRMCSSAWCTPEFTEDGRYIEVHVLIFIYHQLSLSNEMVVQKKKGRGRATTYTMSLWMIMSRDQPCSADPVVEKPGHPLPKMRLHIRIDSSYIGRFPGLEKASCRPLDTCSTTISRDLFLVNRHSQILLLSSRI